MEIRVAVNGHTVQGLVYNGSDLIYATELITVENCLLLTTYMKQAYELASKYLENLIPEQKMPKELLYTDEEIHDIEESWFDEQ